jgi:hypothetical protein
MSAQLQICNFAIGQIRAKRISSINESSLEARECRDHYPQVVASMLEGPHHFSFARRRVVLASAASNDRENEWLYSYNLPSDMRAPIALIPDWDSSGLSLPVALPGDPYAEAWTTLPQATAPYIIEGGVLYSNAGGATLSYVISDIEEAAIPAKVVDALSLDLAGRLAVPVKGDHDLGDKLARRAEIAWQRAIAEDRNRQPEEYPAYVSEVEAAREGY